MGLNQKEDDSNYKFKFIQRWWSDKWLNRYLEKRTTKVKHKKKDE